jgi:hypothetical protein
MSKIHAFTGDTSGDCRVVIHTAMPSGNNLVGQTWKACWLAAGRNVTALAEGTGLGQISSAEKASVLAGDLIEVPGSIPLTVVLQGAAAVNIFADRLIATKLTGLANEFNFYGWTNG